MARQNTMLPKGTFPYPRSPLAETAPHDPAHGPSHGGYPQSYEPPGHAGHAHAPHPHAAHAPDHGDQRPMQTGAQRDIFNALRPDQGLASRIEAFATPSGSRFDPPRQDAYGRGGYTDPSGQPYPAQGAYGQAAHDHDPYGRPLPGGTAYPSHGAYPADDAAGHDPRHYGGHHTEPALDLGQRYPQQGHGHQTLGQTQGYASPQDPYGRDDAYGYDDPYRPDGAHGYAQPGIPGAGQGAEGEYYADEYPDDAETETRRGPRAVVVVGALLAAIGLGGGLAYGYKALTNGGGSSGKLPILRADGAPAKALPTDPGGKQIAHTDKKFLNRLTEDRAPARPVPVSILPPPASERDSAADGTRRVPTLVVNRDGSITPTSSATSPAAPPAVNSVPGMVIEGLTPRLPPPQQRETQRLAPSPSQSPPPLRPAAEDARPAPIPPQAAPKRVASAQPVVATEPPPPAAAAPTETKRRPPAVRQAARTTTDAAAPAVTSGYVAVLASRQSHMDALKTFADIQQKYSSVLQGRTPDVREANLGEKGVWFRVVVGPPGSRESANGVCGQLKTQGYTGCWIMAY